jgi:hypothetical protein
MLSIAALTLPILLGFGALAVDFNNVHDQRLRAQMVADAAAQSAAMAYFRSAQSTLVLLPTAQDIAVANGMPTSAITEAQSVTSPTGSGNSVKVTVTTTVVSTLGKVINGSAGYAIAATAYATLPASTTTTSTNYVSPCFLALSPGSSAIVTSGGATINMPGCDALAVGSINLGSTGVKVNSLVSGSGSITNSYGYVWANNITHASGWTNPGWNTQIYRANGSGSPTYTSQTTTYVDAYASSNNATVSAAEALIGTTTAPTSPSNPSSAACSGASAGNFVTNQTFATGTYNYSSLSISGTAVVTYGNGSTINICSGFTSSGSASINFGNSTVNVNGGFNGNSSGSIIFGNGSVSIGTSTGTGTVKFSAATNSIGNGPVSINGNLVLNGASTLTIGDGSHSFSSICASSLCGGGYNLKVGTGNVDVANGITVTGSSTVAFGAGNYALGRTTATGNCIDVAGSGNLFFGDGTFSCGGGVTTAGGSRIVFGATTNHYFNGTVTIAGAALFGAGAYTINGSLINGTGGTTWPYTSPITGLTYGAAIGGVNYDMIGQNVTFILSGAFNLAGGAKSYFTAPASTTSGGGIANLLVHSATTAATTWGAGANNVFSGLAHLPNSAVTMNGGNSTTSGGCFMLTAKTISVTNGAATGSACSGTMTASTSSTTTTAASSSSISLVF